MAAVERLTSFPNSGRIVPEIRDPVIREIVFGSYRIIYRVKDNLVELFGHIPAKA
ncbi:MAG: type II toxin-antitoxin system RelE/ParE family toxin [Thermodesulfobacteriota bacterium]